MSYSYQRGLSWPLVLFVVVLGFIVFGLFSQPFLFSRRGTGHLTEAGNNAKTIAAALYLFRQEYGSYPDQKTRELLVAQGHDHLPESDHANAYLAQLLAVGLIDTETSFFASLEGVEKGDDEMGPGEILAAGENGFAYVMAETGAALADDISIMPLVLAPVTQGGRNPRFDPKAFGGKYVYGAVDGSSKQGNIGEDGRAMSKGRSSLFETGSNSVFGLEIPVVKMPLKK